MIEEMKMKCILYPIYILYAILSCVPVELDAADNTQIEKKDKKEDEKIYCEAYYFNEYNFFRNPLIDSLMDMGVIDSLMNKSIKRESKLTDKQKSKFDELKENFANNKLKETKIETLEDFIYCITQLSCSTDCPQIREFKLALLTEVETKEINDFIGKTINHYCHFSPQAVILNMILQPDFKVNEKLPQNIKDFIRKTIEKSRLNSYSVRAASMAKSAGFSVKSFLINGFLTKVERLDEGTNLLNLISMFKKHQKKEEIDRRKAIINKDANDDKDANDSDIDNVMQRNDYYTNGYYLAKDFTATLIGIKYFNWGKFYLYNFFPKDKDTYYYLKDKMYEEEYLSEKSKEDTKNIIVKYKEHLKLMETFKKEKKAARRLRRK